MSIMIHRQMLAYTGACLYHTTQNQVDSGWPNDNPVKKKDCAGSCVSSMH